MSENEILRVVCATKQRKAKEENENGLGIPNHGNRLDMEKYS